MTPSKKIPDRAPSGVGTALKKINRQMPPAGFIFLAVVMIGLSALASFNFSPKKQFFLSGEIATTDVTADQGFLFEDSAATREKREQAKSLQPLVLDLVPKAADDLRSGTTALFTELNQASDASEKESLRQKLSEYLGEDVSLNVISILSSQDTQSAVLERLLPIIDEHLREGVIQEMRTVIPYKGGVIIRDLETGEERLQTEANTLSDLKSLEVRVSQEIKSLNLNSQTKKTLNQLFTKTSRPSLVPNYEATKLRASAASSAIQPVVHRVMRGELVVRKGEIVTPEQQMKMQVLLRKSSEFFNPGMFFGLSLCALILSFGLVFAPSNKPVSRLESKDYVFFALLIAVFALTAKGFSLLAVQLSESSMSFTPGSLAYAVPVAGAAGLASLIFTARRYVVNGLLIALFCTFMAEGGIGLFIFYFMACMWSTFLTSRAYSRQDVVKTTLPLLVGLYAMWIGSTLLEGGAYNRFIPEALCILGHAVFSMLLTFAVAPVIEMVFGYTTRFRLMELLNLEQPILRDLMLSAPGTYHHSLIVSNMVEAGANAVGAHSLLCKVAALYHDIGKISKASYFIENQSAEENPHNKLAPSMSALILISHVKQGVELAEQHRLGREVTEIIGQHHGNGIIRYFYHKALQQTNVAPPKEEDFCYPGPKPQTREAALVMLADAVEASSRTLEDPTPHRLQQHIDKIIKNIYSTGQLDETDLTFKDLNRLTESFAKVLRGIFHHRIIYPEKNDKQQPKPTLRLPEKPPSATTQPAEEAPPYTPYSYSTKSGSLSRLNGEKETKEEDFPVTPISTIQQ